MRNLLVYDHLLELSLGGGPLYDLLLNGVGCDKSVDHHGPRLSYPVIDEARVCRRQIDAETSGYTNYICCDQMNI